MFLVENFFKTFTKREICDTKKDTEVIIALSTESRERVDRIIQNVIEAGGTESREASRTKHLYLAICQEHDLNLNIICYHIMVNTYKVEPM